MSGGMTDTDLSSLGEAQAATLAEVLAPELGGVPIYSSPLCRARHTVEALARKTGAQVHLRPDLREIDCGGLEGMSISEVKRHHPNAWEENLRVHNPEFRWPGGESYSEFRRRCLDEVARIARSHAGARVLLVTHAGVVSQVVGAVAAVSAARWDLYRPGNASITELLWGPDGGTVVRFDDRRHLSLTPDHARTACATTRPCAG